MDYAALQGIVALLMDGKTVDAVKAWNTLGVAPGIRAAEMDATGETLQLTLRDGQALILPFDRVIAALDS